MAKSKAPAVIAPANATRGETSIALEGNEYVMRPSWEAIDEFETNTGRSAKELLDAAYADKLKSREIAAVVGACLRARGRQVGDQSIASFRDDRIREIICGEAGGLLLATRKLGVLLLLAVTGGVKSTGEAKPAMTTSPSAPAGSAAGSQV